MFVSCVIEKHISNTKAYQTCDFVDFMIEDKEMVFTINLSVKRKLEKSQYRQFVNMAKIQN